MLVRIQPDQITEKWHVLRPLIRETLPAQLQIAGFTMANILKGLMMEKGQLWAFYGQEEETTKAILLTTVMVDPLTAVPNLLVYSLNALDTLDRDDYIEGVSQLHRFARDLSCSEIIAYVQKDAFAKRLHELIDAEKISNVVRL